MKYTLEGLPGYDTFLKEIEAGKLYNVDHRGNRGAVANTLNKLHPSRIEYVVTDIRSETKTAKTIRLASANRYLPPFIPGQYISVEAEIGGIKTTRPYTISSPSTQRAYYEITVAESKNGFVSNHLLSNLKIGDSLFSSGPSGNFYQFTPIHGKRLVFIASGSGITPFMSMLQSDYEKLIKDKSVDLIYRVANEDDVVFKDRLKALEEKGVVSLHIVSSGPVTAEFITKNVKDAGERVFFLSGPQSLYDSVLPELAKLKVPGRCIRREVQNLPDDPGKLDGWPGTVKTTDTFKITLSDGRSFSAKAGETILTALERNGVTPPTNCRGGICSACRTKLVAGTVFHPGNELLRKSDMRFGFIHPCVTYPISDIHILM